MAFCEEIKTKEELYEILTLIYDVDEKTAEIIIDNLTNRHRLSESEEILLESHGIEKDFIESVQNNKNLIGYDTEEPNISLVGPFFYINKKLYTHSVAVKDFKNDERFYNDPISHFDYFNSLGIPGDYGNYPRGRVIYDSLDLPRIRNCDSVRSDLCEHLCYGIRCLFGSDNSKLCPFHKYCPRKMPR